MPGQATILEENHHSWESSARRLVAVYEKSRQGVTTEAAKSVGQQ